VQDLPAYSYRTEDPVQLHEAKRGSREYLHQDSGVEKKHRDAPHEKVLSLKTQKTRVAGMGSTRLSVTEYRMHY